jgi:hypothetical protein
MELQPAAAHPDVDRCYMHKRNAGWPRSGLLLALALSFTASLLRAGEPISGSLKSEEIEAFLRRAKVLRSRSLNIGVTGTKLVTLTDGRLTHRAHVQAIDESKTTYQTAMGTELNFRDCYKFNIAAYRLDRMLGLNMTPPSIQRRWKGQDSAFTWWVADAIMEGQRIKKKLEPPDVDAFNKQMYTVRVFDQLVFNTDRNLQNLLVTPDWNLWMIDHTRAFRIRTDLAAPRNLVKCDRKLLERLRLLNKKTLKEQLGDCLQPNEINAILRRRDKIVALFDRKIAREGEDRILFDMPLREPVWIVQPKSVKQ